jgi:dipeptidyl aminopeptidase/acylaminoacyl peptidase
MRTPAPIALDRIADRQSPSDPRISPDGSAVVVTVEHLSKREDRARRQLWMIRGGADPFPFTGIRSDASDPQWSPDGSRLVFVSPRDDKDERSGLFMIRSDGGEAQQIGSLRGEISQPRWSPDGSCIAFVMKDPETEAEKTDREAKRDHVVVESEPKHLRLWIMDPGTGKHRCLTTANRSVRDFTWAPDGLELVVVTTTQPNANSLYAPTRLARLPAAGGLERELDTFAMAPWQPIVRDVSGKRVVVVVANDHRADPSLSIWEVGWDGGKCRNVLPELRGTVVDIVPDPEASDRLLAVIVEGTYGRLYSVSLETGYREPLSPGVMGGRGSITAGISASDDGQHVAFVWSGSDETDEVWTLDRLGPTAKRTSFGASFAGELSPGETVRWHSDDGVEIEGVLIRPTDIRGPLPLMVQVHGGPAWQWEDRLALSWHDWAQMLASRGWAVLMPNPRGSTGYGSAFQKLLQDDVGGGESMDLVAGAAAMVERGIADGDRLAIGGWSWGGYLTARTITRTSMFKAAIVGAGVANLASDHGAGDIPESSPLILPGQPYDERTWEAYALATPIREAMHVTTPTLILHGDSDERVHPTQGQELFRALQHAGVPVQFVRYPREAHSILEREHQIDLMERIVAWLDRWVPTGM